MATQADIESYLMRAGLDYEEVEEGTLVIRGEAEHTADVVMRVDDPIVVYRMKVTALPEKGIEDFLRKLLTINAREMLHASFGLEDDIPQGLFVLCPQPLVFEIGGLDDLGDGGQGLEVEVAFVLCPGQNKNGVDHGRGV